MKIKLNSSLFHVTQPCGYWVFQDYLYGLEEREMEYLEERANEVVDIPEKDQPWLEGLKGGDFKSKTACTSVIRKNLPVDHPEYACEQEVSIDSDKALEVIAKCWLDVFEDWISDRYRDLNRKNKIKLCFRGTWSPREYNFNHDESDFTLSIPKSEMNYIIKSCFVDDRAGFEEYLYKAHSSYDGYMSFVSNNISEHERAWARFKAGASVDGDIEHLLWVCLDYWLFGMVRMDGYSDELTATDKESVMVQRWEKNQDEFERNLWDKVTDAEGDGAFSACMEYEPIERKEEKAA